MCRTWRTWTPHLARSFSGSRRATRWGTTPKRQPRRARPINWMYDWHRHMGRKAKTMWCCRRMGFTSTEQMATRSRKSKIGRERLPPGDLLPSGPERDVLFELLGRGIVSASGAIGKLHVTSGEVYTAGYFAELLYRVSAVFLTGARDRK